MVADLLDLMAFYSEYRVLFIDFNAVIPYGA